MGLGASNQPQWKTHKQDKMSGEKNIIGPRKKGATSKANPPISVWTCLSSQQAFTHFSPSSKTLPSWMQRSCAHVPTLDPTAQSQSGDFTWKKSSRNSTIHQTGLQDKKHARRPAWRTKKAKTYIEAGENREQKRYGVRYWSRPVWTAALTQKTREWLMWREIYRCEEKVINPKPTCLAGRWNICILLWSKKAVVQERLSGHFSLLFLSYWDGQHSR